MQKYAYALAILVVGFLICVKDSQLAIWEKWGDEEDEKEMSPAPSERGLQENQKRKLRSLEELEALMAAADEKWDHEGLVFFYREAFMRVLVSDWSQDEIEMACRDLPLSPWHRLLLERWGRFDFAAARKGVLEILHAKWSAFDPEGRVDDFGMGGDPLSPDNGFFPQGAFYYATFEGGAESYPGDVWDFFWADPEIDLHGRWNNFFREVALAKVSEAFASGHLKEALTLMSSDKLSERDWTIVTRAVVKGAPVASNWGVIIDILRGREGNATNSIIRKDVMARWLEMDFREAESWFFSEQAEGVGWSPTFPVTPGQRSEGRLTHSLAKAARLWLRKDPDVALAWISRSTTNDWNPKSPKGPEFVIEMILSEWGSVATNPRETHALIQLFPEQFERDRLATKAINWGDPFGSGIPVYLDEEAPESMDSQLDSLNLSKHVSEKIRSLIKNGQRSGNFRDPFESE